MGGIILLVVLSIWIFLANVIAKYLLSKIQLEPGKKKTFAHIGLFILVFIAPVADDIIGGFQFRAMCSEGGVPIYVKEEVQGKTIKYQSSGWEYLNNTIIPIREITINWVDPETDKVLFSYKDYKAKGGLLSRFIGFPEGSPPYTFNASCGNGNRSLLTSLKVKRLYK